MDGELDFAKHRLRNPVDVQGFGEVSSVRGASLDFAKQPIGVIELYKWVSRRCVSIHEGHTFARGVAWCIGHRADGTSWGR